MNDLKFIKCISFYSSVEFLSLSKVDYKYLMQPVSYLICYYICYCMIYTYRMDNGRTKKQAS